MIESGIVYSMTTEFDNPNPPAIQHKRRETYEELKEDMLAMYGEDSGIWDVMDNYIKDLHTKEEVLDESDMM